MYVVYVKNRLHISQRCCRTRDQVYKQYDILLFFSPSKIAVNYPLVLVSHCPCSSDLWLGDFRVSRCERWRNLANKRVIQGLSWLKGWKIDDSLRIYGYLLISCSFSPHNILPEDAQSAKKNTQRYTIHWAYLLRLVHSELWGMQRKHVKTYRFATINDVHVNDCKAILEDIEYPNMLTTTFIV